jgi:HD-GYP domain-containing protein (c-di-GMP phosphodiesterase class II)
MIKCHPQIGHDLLKSIDLEWPIAEIVFQHHERIDGSGYPRGLSGNSIMIEAKIISVADVIESMLSHRPYRPALSIEMVRNEIEQGKGKKYDQEVAEAGLSFLERTKLV